MWSSKLLAAPVTSWLISTQVQKWASGNPFVPKISLRDHQPGHGLDPPAGTVLTRQPARLIRPPDNPRAGVSSACRKVPIPRGCHVRLPYTDPRPLTVNTGVETPLQCQRENCTSIGARVCLDALCDFQIAGILSSLPRAGKARRAGCRPTSETAVTLPRDSTVGFSKTGSGTCHSSLRSESRLGKRDPCRTEIAFRFR